MWNDGAGNFTLAGAAQWPSLGGIVVWLGVGDFDDDGRLDIIVARSTGPMIWRRNLGGGVFGIDLPIASPVSSLHSGTVGDYNGDGVDDLYVVNTGGAQGQAFGSPIGLSPVVMTGGFELPAAPAVAVDLDADGRDDLLRSVRAVGAGQNGGQIVLQRGSAGGLGPPVPLVDAEFLLGSDRPFPGFAALDADSDGTIDLAIVPGESRPWLLLDRGAAGVLVAPTALPIAARGRFVPARDVDGDGDADLLQLEQDGGVVRLVVHPNDGRGCFRGPPQQAGSFVASFAPRARWFDFDGDGDEDLWLTGGTVTPSRVMQNDGVGGFAEVAAILVGPIVSSVAFGDFDGDQVIDIVAARVSLLTPEQPVLIRGIIGPAGLAYAAPVPFGVPDFISDLAVLDLGQDGDLDVIAGTPGGTSGGPVRVYENDGSGGFATLSQFVGATGRSVAVGDVNGDGCPDVVLGSQSWLCQGLAFVLQSSHATPVGLISLADIDGDGHLDLVDSAGSWSPGDGAGNFATPIDYVPFRPIESAVTTGREPVDLDGDGDLDMFAPLGVSLGQLGIYSNLTRQAAPTSLAQPGRSLGLAVHGRVGDPWLLAVSLPATTSVPLPPFGTLFLDPLSALVVAAGAIPIAGRSEFAVAIPAGTGGLSLAWQAAVGPQLRLSNAFDTRILP